MATQQGEQEAAVTQQPEDEAAAGGEAIEQSTKPAPKKKVLRKPAKKQAKKRAGAAGKKNKKPNKKSTSGDASGTKPAETKEDGAGNKNPKGKGGNPFAQVRRTIKEHLPKIVDKMVKEAEEGSCTHAKTILEISGAKRMFDGEHEVKDKGEPWAKLVLQKLDEAEPEAAAEAATADGGSEGNS